MKIVILDGYAMNPGDLSYGGLEALGELRVYDRTFDEDIISRIGNAEAVYVNKTPILKETLDACPNLKWVGIFATGYNVVDFEYAASKGVLVANVPGYSTDAVAQMTFALLLEMCQYVGEHTRSVIAGDWSRNKNFCYWKFPLMELKGKTFGIIGLGQIGLAVAKIAKAFGMNVIYYSRTKKSFPGYVDLDTLFENSDIISLHCPLFESTAGIINEESIAKMKDGVILLNTSRGGLVIEEDLKRALDAGKITGFGCDVATTEPINADSPLLAAKNVVITPHIAWAPLETRTRLLGMATENLKSYIDGNPMNVVN